MKTQHQILQPEPKPHYGLTFIKFTTIKQEKYLRYLEEGATLGGAAKKVGVSRQMVREYGREYPHFARLAQEARERGLEAMTDDIEDALAIRAKQGNVSAMVVWLLNRRPSMWEDKRNNKIRSIDDFLAILPRELGERVKQLLFEEISERNRIGLPNPQTEEEY